MSMRFTPLTTYRRFDNETDRLCFHHEQEKQLDNSSKSGLTALEAAWNVTNAIQVNRFLFIYRQLVSPIRYSDTMKFEQETNP